MKGCLSPPLCYQRGLKAFNVLAALATGGLGVSGLEPACGLPYPTPAPPVCRGAAEGRPPHVMCPPPRPSRGRDAALACPRVAAPLLPAPLDPLPLPPDEGAGIALAPRRA